MARRRRVLIHPSSFILHPYVFLAAFSASIPGLHITGYGVLEAADGRLRLCEAGVVRGRATRQSGRAAGNIYAGIADVIAACSRK